MKKMVSVMLGVALTFSVLGTVNANAAYDLSGQYWNYVRVKKTTLSDSDFSGNEWSSPRKLWVNFTVDPDGEPFLMQTTLKPYYNKNVGKDKAYTLVAAVNAGVGVDASITADGSTSYAPTQRGIATQTPTISVADGTYILYRGVAYWN